MRWETGLNHQSKIPPRVTVTQFPNPNFEPEVKIDFRGLGVYLSLAEARQLSTDLAAATPPQEGNTK